MQAIRLQKKYPEISQEEMFDLINRFKCVSSSCLYALWAISFFPLEFCRYIICADNFGSAISTETPGRVDKAAAITALQNSGESYDRVRETLKSVSVDASGKVELEDWVEVSLYAYLLPL